MKKIVLMFISLVVGLIGVAIVAVLFLFYRATSPITKEAQVMVTIIHVPTPTATEEVEPELNPTAMTTADVSSEENNIQINSVVQVKGTQGEGLRLREKPGLGNTIVSLAYEAETFIVLDGPQQADGFRWWYIVDFSNEKRRGWAAENYLQLIE